MLYSKYVFRLVVFCFLITNIVNSCRSKKQEGDEEDFKWGKPVLVTSNEDLIRKINPTLTPDEKTISILFDKEMNLGFLKDDVIDTTISLSVAIPVKGTEKDNLQINNDLRYFISRDSLVNASVQIKVGARTFDVIPNSKDTNQDNQYKSFTYSLTSSIAQNDTISYSFYIRLSKPKSDSNFLVQLESLDIVANKPE